MLFIRPATPSDAKDIAKVHVQSWRETYTGLIPDQLMKENTIENRTKYWGHTLRNMPANTQMFVAEFFGAGAPGIVGFGLCGPDQVGLSGFKGEVQALYICEEGKGRGLGRKLIQACGKYLAAKDMHPISVWAVLENHNARQFYQYMGGSPIASRYLQIGPDRVREAAYGWADPEVLLKA